MKRQRVDYGVVDIESPGADANGTASDSESTQSMTSSGREWAHRSTSSSTKPSQFAAPVPSTSESLLGSLCGIQAWICVLSAFSGFVFGYDLCVMVIALPLIQKVRASSAMAPSVFTLCACAYIVCGRCSQDFGLSTAYAESVVSTLMVGAVVGSLGGGVMADWCVIPFNHTEGEQELHGSWTITVPSFDFPQDWPQTSEFDHRGAIPDRIRLHDVCSLGRDVADGTLRRRAGCRQ